MLNDILNETAGEIAQVSKVQRESMNTYYGIKHMNTNAQRLIEIH